MSVQHLTLSAHMASFVDWLDGDEVAVTDRGMRYGLREMCLLYDQWLEAYDVVPMVDPRRDAKRFSRYLVADPRMAKARVTMRSTAVRQKRVWLGTGGNDEQPTGYYLKLRRGDELIRSDEVVRSSIVGALRSVWSRVSRQVVSERALRRHSPEHLAALGVVAVTRIRDVEVAELADPVEPLPLFARAA